MRPLQVAMIVLALAIPASGAAQSDAATPAGDEASSPDTASPAQLSAMREMMADTAPSPPTSYSLVKEKGRVVLRGLPWARGNSAIQPGAEGIFGQAVSELAAEILPTTTMYKIEVKVEAQASKEQSHLLAKQRAARIVSALVGQGVPQVRLMSAGGGADKDPRVVLSETTTSR